MACRQHLFNAPNISFHTGECMMLTDICFSQRSVNQSRETMLKAKNSLLQQLLCVSLNVLSMSHGTKTAVRVVKRRPWRGCRVERETRRRTWSLSECWRWQPSARCTQHSEPVDQVLPDQTTTMTNQRQSAHGPHSAVMQRPCHHHQYHHHHTHLHH